MVRYDYETDWCGYTYPETNEISTDQDVISEFRSIDITGESFQRCGVPILVKNGKAVVNDKTENTIIYGETGSKKTRSVIAPLIALAAGAGESAFITDVKGELSTNPKLQGFLKKKGVKTVYLDFRTFKGDCYNILEYGFNMYRRGEEDKAMGYMTKIINSLVARYETAKDPFWGLSSQQYLVPLINLIFDACARKPEYYDMVNMYTLSTYANFKAAEKIGDKVENLSEDCGTMLSMLKSVTGNPNNTLSCIMSTVQSVLQDFTIQEDLLKMLSATSFDLEAMYETPTFVFLIVPDETSTYDTIAGMLIDMFYDRLVETYSRKYQNNKEAPCRINYICDEFCNLKINDMKAKISASRSRNMRWYLVCQSKSQLENTYSEAATTIIGNCKNILFLQSSDLSMLSYISDLCGETQINEKGITEPIVKEMTLKNLKLEKEFKEAVFIRGNIRYFTRLPDIDSYEFLKKYASKKPFVFPNKCNSKIKAYTVGMLVDDIDDYVYRDIDIDDLYCDDDDLF
ncbi:MAG: type IV secretory system conjugative DNA transfer family protein [Ruminiclostridium sp.]|nr:type IV secretory system conjugative DNA transfer family protein [Ruminiclostridium sp.]